MARPKKSEGGVNKMEAVRQILAKHGKDTKPGQIVELAKSEHGAELSYDMASTYKSAVLRKAGGGKKRGRKPGRKPGVPVASSQNGSQVAGISLEDIRAVKILADRLGADKVRQLAEVLAK